MEDELFYTTKYPLRLRDCEHYDECFEKAAFKNEEKFDCQGCKKYIQEDIP
jgi:hypothetical protein